MPIDAKHDDLQCLQVFVKDAVDGTNEKIHIFKKAEEQQIDGHGHHQPSFPLGLFC